MYELTADEIDAVAGAGEVGDAIRAIGETIDDIGDAFYRAGYRIGKAIRG